jgi:hypothetical protein
MSRSTYDVQEDYTGNGLLADYTFDFKIEDPTHLLVVKYNTLGVEVFRVRGDDTTYLDSLEYDATLGGGTVHLKAVVEDQYTLKLLLANDSPTQTYEFKNKFSFTLARIEAALDFLLGPVQRLAYLAKRSIKLDDYDSPDTFDPTLPPGLSANTSDLIPHIITGGWADIADWTPVADLQAAVLAAAAAAASEAAAATYAAAALAAQVAAEAAQAAAEVAAGTPQIINTRGAPGNQSGASAIDVPGSYRYNIIYLQGSGGAIDLSALNPQIASGGAVDTKKLTLIGRSDTNTVRIVDGNGVVLKGGGELILYADTVAEFFWDTTNWVQI